MSRRRRRKGTNNSNTHSNKAWDDADLSEDDLYDSRLTRHPTTTSTVNPRTSGYVVTPQKGDQAVVAANLAMTNRAISSRTHPIYPHILPLLYDYKAPLV